MKQLFLDLETSGLDEKKHGVRDIAGLIIDSNPHNDPVMFTIRCNIPPFKEWDPYVKDTMLSGDISAYENAMTWQEAFGDITSILQAHVNPFEKTDKFHLYAYNAQFDERHLRQFWTDNDNQYYGSYFWKPTIDVMALAGEYLNDERHQLDNFKLETVARYLGIEVEEHHLHEAMYDVKLMYQVYQAIKQ